MKREASAYLSFSDACSPRVQSNDNGNEGDERNAHFRFCRGWLVVSRLENGVEELCVNLS
jgi:hypothetical protein